MLVHLVQPETHWHDAEANHRAVAQLCAGLLPGGLIVLPETFATGYTMDVPLAAASAEATGQFLVDLARQNRCHVLGGLVTTNAAGRGLNTAVLLDPVGNEIGRYEKLYPFSFAGEDRHYDPGPAVRVFDVAGVKLAPFICYDLRFPEAFREAALAGAEVFAVIANWPAARQAHFQTLLAARAIENVACCLGVNRTGTDPNVAYDGGSTAFDANGEALVRPAAAAGVYSFELDVEAFRTRRAEFPVLADARRRFWP